MSNVFRLVSEVRVFCNQKTKEIYLFDPENKKHRKEIEGILPNKCCWKEYQLPSTDIKIKFPDSSPSAYVSSPNFPGGIDVYYKLKNFNYNGIWEIISSCNIKDGVVEGDFEVIVDSESSKIGFVCPSMPSYMEVFNEMTRLLNCKLCKKTKTYKVGHRYDTETETLYYLGNALSRLSNVNNSIFCTCPDKEVYLFTKDIKDCKKISEFLDNSILKLSNGFETCSKYGTIIVKYNKSLMVDSGEALEDDGVTLFDKYDRILSNTLDSINSNVEKVDGYKNYLDLSRLFDLLSLVDPKSVTAKYQPDVVESVKNQISKVVQDLIIEFWDTDRSSLGSKNTLNTNVDAVKSMFFRCFRDLNIQKHQYFSSLFEYMGIDLLSIISEQLNHCNYNILDDFEIHRKYRRGVNYDITLRTEKSSRYHINIVKLTEKLTSSYLIDCIKDLVKFSRENFGMGVSHYETINIGSKSSPLVYECIVINLQNIIDFYNKEKGIEIPENLKYGIVSDNFKQVIISVDKDSEIE